MKLVDLLEVGITRVRPDDITAVAHSEEQKFNRCFLIRQAWYD